MVENSDGDGSQVVEGDPEIGEDSGDGSEVEISYLQPPDSSREGGSFILGNEGNTHGCDFFEVIIYCFGSRECGIDREAGFGMGFDCPGRGSTTHGDTAEEDRDAVMGGLLNLVEDIKGGRWQNQFETVLDRQVGIIKKYILCAGANVCG